MQIPRLRNVSLLRNSLISSTFTTTHFAFFHSTPTSCEKWKKKWDFDIKGSQQPTKNYVRYATRQKRADAKKALKNLLYKSGSLEDEELWKIGGQAEKPGNSHRKHKPKSSTPHAEKYREKKIKRKFKKHCFCEDFDEHHEPFFQATFGNRWYTWSFNSSQDSFSQSTTSGFEWREHSSWKNKSKTWSASSETESDDESYTVGSCSDRTILGLPPTGPLKIDDVKKAFRLSALKWHPDKHQGPSQATAEEKFKHCVNAYKSLCNAVSPA
ncbi:hypothetical protein FNV43_RR18809 [Rhamnella rubrinervis]|uniref:J domain-containing protein n=1 Tax=Rhamnella rubrinervis TaxID=2594499 RepID=A0A8K0E018_9ROSA|nr:hypothetical protein FNV43_RR18809 [Rhamnella rubrinervis]